MHAGKPNGKTNAIFSQHTITIVSAISLFYVVLTVCMCVSLSPCPFTHTHTNTHTYIHTYIHTHTHTLCCRSFGWLKKKRESRESRFIVVVVACSLSTVDVDFRTYSLRYSVFTSTLSSSSSSSSLPSSFLRSWRRLPSTLLYHQHQFHHYHQLQQLFNHSKWFQIE
jgi:hypothetical protein